MSKTSNSPTTNPRSKTLSLSKGFTIVELLVVIVVIGILATITVVSYTGISNKAIISSLQSDLSSASKQLKMFSIENGSFPTTISTNCTTNPTNTTNLCLKQSPGNSYTSIPYSNPTPQSFILTAVNGTNTYYITENSSPIAGVYVDQWANWYSGIAATALAGKYIYKTDLGSTYTYRTTNTAVASPQGATGLDPNYPSYMSLVSPQTNPGVDFSAYPAQNACKAIGGRLPNMQELLAIYTGRASYGNNFQAINFWSSTEYDSTIAYYVYFSVGGTAGENKTGSLSVRCVSG